MNIKLFISMKKYKKLKLFLVALIIIVQGVHSGGNPYCKTAAFTSIRLSQEIHRSYQNPNSFDYEHSNQSLLAKLSITLAITNILLLIIFTIRKLLHPNEFGMFYMIMIAIIICIEILLIMDSCYRFYYRDDPYQTELANISADSNSILIAAYVDLKLRLFILTEIQFGLSMAFDLTAVIIFSIQLYQGCRNWKRNHNEVLPLENGEENKSQEYEM